MFRQGFYWVLDANGNQQFDGTGPGLISHLLLAGLTETGRSLGAGKHTVALSLHDAFSPFAVIQISAQRMP